jgi:hypothetical protein
MFIESLTTHSKLVNIDILSGSDVLSHLDISDKVKATLVLLTNRFTHTGRHAIMFNLTVDDIIKTSESGRFTKLASKNFRELFVELYDNNKLSDKEVELVSRVTSREYNAVVMIASDKCVKACNYMPYVEAKMPNGYPSNSNPRYIEAFELVSNIEDRYSSPYCDCRLVRVKDKNTGKLFTFDSTQMAVRFSEGVYEDPSNGVLLPPGIINYIKKTLDIEIRLFSRPIDVAHVPTLKMEMMSRPIAGQGRLMSPMLSPMLSPAYRKESLPTLKEGRLITPAGDTDPMTFHTKINTPLPELKSPFRSSGSKINIHSGNTPPPMLINPSIKLSPRSHWGSDTSYSESPGSYEGGEGTMDSYEGGEGTMDSYEGGEGTMDSYEGGEGTMDSYEGGEGTMDSYEGGEGTMDSYEGGEGTMDSPNIQSGESIPFNMVTTSEFKSISSPLKSTTEVPVTSLPSTPQESLKDEVYMVTPVKTLQPSRRILPSSSSMPPPLPRSKLPPIGSSNGERSLPSKKADNLQRARLPVINRK